MNCPNCGAQAEGAFCSSCGTPLKGAKCRACQAPLVTGARFCNQCGAATGVRGANQGKLPWVVAGIALVALVAVIAWVGMRDDTTTSTAGGVPLGDMGGASVQGAAGPGPLTGTPREQADRLFNRVMTERERGDTAQARFFVPMAVQAYDRAGATDADALYHVSLLHHVAGDYDAALAAARQILATSPNHLLALSAAANAARDKGDSAAARGFYQQFISAFETESASTRQEYVDHANMLPQLKSEAEAFLRGR